MENTPLIGRKRICARQIYRGSRPAAVAAATARCSASPRGDLRTREKRRAADRHPETRKRFTPPRSVKYSWGNIAISYYVSGGESLLGEGSARYEKKK